jgi:uridine phosphorylase
MINFDPDKTSLCNASNLQLEGKPKSALMIFDDEIWEDYILKDPSLKTQPVKNVQGRVFDTFRIYNHQGEDIVMMSPSTGASGSAIELELLIASGISRIVAFGTAGALKSETPKNSIVLPSAAIREEGVSYHYLPPSEQVACNPKVLNIIKGLLDQKRLNYLTGKVWTTDAVYRETPGKLSQMVDKGCVAVDMEMASLMAVAEFRGVTLAGFLIIEDNIAGHTNEAVPRDPIKLLDLAIELVSLI